jgi:signal peptide peptidase SppA
LARDLWSRVIFHWRTSLSALQFVFQNLFALDRRPGTAQVPAMLTRFLPWRRPRINVIEMHGLIAPRPGAVSAGTMAPLIDRAFRTARGQPVILDIESPGGSPVQSDLIATLVRRRADEHKVRVHAVIREVGASGGYWLACAADEIHANPMSIVGSIGVRGGGFGFPDVLARIGIERRLYTAGSNKARLDPFRPEKPEDVAFVQDLLDALHERFKAWVRSRRGDRLKADEAALFDGSFMLGERALEVGLIDGFADIDSLVRKLGGDRMKSRVLRPRRRGLLQRLPRVAVDALFDAIEARRARIDLLP